MSLFFNALCRNGQIPAVLSLSLSRPTEGQANKNPLDNNRVNSVTNKRRTGPRHGKRIHILRQYRTSTMKVNETHLAAIRESGGRSSEVERSFMVRWVVGSILHGVDPLSYFFYMHHPTDRIAHTTAFVTPVVEYWLEREIAQWVHPMKNRSDDPSHHERTLLPRSYISLLSY